MSQSSDPVRRLRGPSGPATPRLRALGVVLAILSVLGASAAAASAAPSQTISFSSSAPTSATVGGPTYKVSAAASSKLAVTLTKATAAVCAGIAAAPIPVADIVPLTTLQLGLVTAIAWIAGRTLDKRGASEFLGGVGANVGLAFALRETVRAILKVIAPGGGPIVSAAIASSGTIAIGSAAQAYFIRGVSLEDAENVFRKSKSNDDGAS
jgi:uncharacterized protein (DUF697 family)